MHRLFWPFLIILVIFRYFTGLPHYADGQKLKITAKVLEEPVRYSFKQKIDLVGLKIYLPLFPEIGYGDRVVVEGEVEKGELIDPQLISVSQNRNWLYRFRTRIIDYYRKSLPEPHASLVAGIVLGSKAEIPESFWTNLKKAGVAHVVVASGMNVTFVASFLMAFLVLFLPRRWAIPWALLGIWFYALLAGFESPIVRAAVMATTTFTAQATGRLAFSGRVLLLTALGMLLYRPDWITDTGFLLTFTATASLMLFQKRVARIFRFIPEILGFVKEGLVTTVAAQIGVAPIIFATFGQFNPISPLINAAVLWVVPLIMILGGLGGLIGMIFPAVGRLFLYLGYPLTWWFCKMVGS